MRFNGTCDTCGRPTYGPALGESGGVGYATDSEMGLRHCYVCCADHDRAYMRKHGRIDLYISHDNFSPSSWRITNWPGSLDLNPTVVRKGAHNIARTRFDAWFKFDGANWHGVNIGDNQILRCKRLKAS